MEFIRQSPLRPIAAALGSGALDLFDTIDQACTHLETFNPQIEAFLSEPDRRKRLHREALDLQKRFPDHRPPLYGVLVGVKDIFRVDGFPTQAGSQLPPEVLAGVEASVVSKLRDNGALILGKTVTAEFAYLEPGVTRNPHNLAHTPGGSSSGSAAAVAAGFCPLALGTQTIGSVIRPAAYCGIVGFKPSYGRIPTDGVISVSTALDHVGLFTQDVAGMELAAALLCRDWRAVTEPDTSLPTLGVPVGAYLEQASPAALDVFESQVRALENAGYVVRRIAALNNFEAIREHNLRLMSAEMADSHASWFAQYESHYRAGTARTIRSGQAVTPEQRQDALVCQREIRAELSRLMETHGIDVWITPAATDAAPLGLGSTGDSAMNLPWTLIGFPAITVPTSSKSTDGLPFGLQCSAAFMQDERLLQWSRRLAQVMIVSSS